jgi:hypothetical protein
MTYEELITSLEIARIALEKFESYIGHELDLNDDYITELNDHINYFLDLEFCQIELTRREKLEILLTSGF